MGAERALERRAGRQQGLITRHQAVAAGLSPTVIQRRLAAGRWRRIGPAVYALGGAVPTWRQRVLAACLAAGADAVASHRTAAALWGLSGFGPKRIEITRPRGASYRSELCVVHQSVQLEAVDVSAIDRIPVTRPARTLIDLAGCVDASRLEDAVDDAVIRGLVTLERLERRARALGRRGRTGTERLRAVLATWQGDGMPESVAEQRLVRRLVAAGLPKPELQHQVWDNGVLVARLDTAWPEARTAFELDGFRWHASPRKHRGDRHRHNHLKALGWTVFQATPGDLRTDGRELAALALPLVVTLSGSGGAERRRA